MMRLTLLLIALLWALPAESANHFIRDGGSASTTGTGNCSSAGSGSWATANACDVLPSTLVRGDTYYVASGVYAGRTFSTAPVSTTLITIKGATVSDHGGMETGWTTAMSVDTRDGGSHAIWGALTFSTSYWVFDGAVHGTLSASAPVQRTKTAYGFQIGNPTNGGGNAITIGAPTSGTTTDYTFRNIVSTSVDADGNCNETRFIATTVCCPINNVTASYVMGDNWENFIKADSDGPSVPHNNWVLEYAFVENGFSSGNCHGEDINTGYSPINAWHIRYSVFTGRSGGTATIACGLNGVGTNVTNMSVYGNVFDNQLSGDADTIASVHANCVGLKFYNNTSLNLGSFAQGSLAYIGGNSEGSVTGEVTNNLVYNSIANIDTKASAVTRLTNAFFSATSIHTGTGNYITTGNPFVNSAAGDYRLTQAAAAAMTAGTTLASPYDTDPNGVVRGATGKFDRGAFDYCESDCGGEAPPASPGQFNLHLRLRAMYDTLKDVLARVLFISDAWAGDLADHTGY